MPQIEEWRFGQLPADAGFELVREDLEISKLAKKILPAWLVAKIPDIPFGRNILITNMEYILT